VCACLCVYAGGYGRLHVLSLCECADLYAPVCVCGYHESRLML